LTSWWDLDDPEAYLYEADMMFMGMHEGLFWSDCSGSGESVTVGTGIANVAGNSCPLPPPRQLPTLYTQTLR